MQFVYNSGGNGDGPVQSATGITSAYDTAVGLVGTHRSAHGELTGALPSAISARLVAHSEVAHTVGEHRPPFLGPFDLGGVLGFSEEIFSPSRLTATKFFWRRTATAAKLSDLASGSAETHCAVVQRIPSRRYRTASVPGGP